MNLFFYLTRPRRLLFCFFTLAASIIFLVLVATESDPYFEENQPNLQPIERYRFNSDERQFEKLNLVVKRLSRGKDGERQSVSRRPTKSIFAPKSGEALATSGVKMAAPGSDKSFDPQRVLKLFTVCREDGDILATDCYVDAYEELCKLFRLFGTVFTFVSSDVEEKIGILREYRKGDMSEEYKTIQRMLEYEVEKGLTNNKKKASGARTLLRLHRALEFVSLLLAKIKDTENSAKFAPVASKAYDATLAKFHPWLIKQGVHLAMHMLPSRQDLLKKMNVEDTDEGKAGLTSLIDEINKIYDITQKLYEKDKLLELP